MRALEPSCTPYAPCNDERASRRKTAQISRVNDSRGDAMGPPHRETRRSFFLRSTLLFSFFYALLRFTGREALGKRVQGVRFV